MKAADAHLKWCPFSFVRLGNRGPATNRNMVNPLDIGVCYCLGTHCAVWRGTEKDGRCGLASDKDAP